MAAMARRERPPPRPERLAAFRVGISAETRAAAFLMAKGFRILAKRWKSPLGEIDLIARRGKLLVFAEVKARAAGRCGGILEYAPAPPNRGGGGNLARRQSRRRHPRYSF
jgi:Uncharacterised protein family UPF0102